ncbi:C45 family autoproteolytic acyltransferase/hydolase [Leucobacter komagatae]|uniref:Peptidase C45 hydrolase domain-containing protein n=1 Tax=Leucobacter komagatae TaxID=55969 RepID=A0A0D0HWX9_9MICO|nr:C45 family peptidase [Leucobacter komagatae]KIP52111.1 hypothetical protein SD72_11235 [Leucobacter komagatae]
MIGSPQRPHLVITGASRTALGESRGRQLGEKLLVAYEAYSELFRGVGVSEEAEREAAARTVEGLLAWRPELVDELAAIATATGLTLLQVAALNARTEVLSGSPTFAARECSTVAATIGGRQYGAQTWDWHVELADFWHTQEVSGVGYRYVGLTESGIVSKIGVNSAGLALHFNILGHGDDRAGGVPMHMLSALVLAECASVDEAVALVREAPVTSSSAFTLIDSARSVSLEMSPRGVREIHGGAGSVVRTNHFIDAGLVTEQKHALYEPDSSERFDLLTQRLADRAPASREQLIDALVSGPGEPPLCCVPDMSRPFGERWATLSTVVTDPERRSIMVLDGMPSEADDKPWRVLDARSETV